MTRTIGIALIAIAVLAFPNGTADGTILVKKDLKQLCMEAKRIVVGRVIAQEASWLNDTRLIFTQTTIEVEETLLGKHEKIITVAEIGGTVGDITCRVENMPRFSIGDNVLLALVQDPFKQWRVHGAIQGRFNISFNKVSEERMVRLQPGLEYVTNKYFPRSEGFGTRAVSWDIFREKVIAMAAKNPVNRTENAKKGDVK